MPVRIVVPDDFPPALTGSAAEARLRVLGEATVHTERGADREDELIRRIGDAEAVVNIRAHARFTERVLAACPRLRLVSIWGTGTDNVDLAACRARGIAVTNTPGVNAHAVAEHTLALMLAVTRRIPAMDRDVRGGQWPRGLDFGSDRYRAPLSVRAGVRALVWRDLAVDLGAGTGVAWFGNAGYGRESFRVFAGLRWEHIVPAASDDRDRDGVTDLEDRCPDQPGPAELDGCPDRDDDEIPDVEDKCPDQPGPAKNDGCPPPPEQPAVEIETSHLSLKDAINFDTGRDTIRPKSEYILGEIAAVLKAHPELGRIRIEGHTDSVGGRAYNLDLSRRRARAVVRSLVRRGVAAERLTSEGYGFERPVAPNTTPLGRAKNRRVEFTLLQQAEPRSGKDQDR